MQLSQTDSKRFLSQSIDFNYKMLVSACKFMTLYLLQINNQGQFIFEDPLQRKYKVKLGELIQCNCHEGNLGHCIHSLYVLIRIYKLPQSHPLIFKKSFNQEDINFLRQQSKLLKNLQIKSSKKTNNQCLEQVLIESTQKQKHKIAIQPEPQIKKVEKNKNLPQWPVFQPETVCSICYDQIENQTPIIDCWSCHNYFHTKCLKVWINQKRNQQNQTISCPMCRGNFESLIDQRIIKMNKYYVDYHQSHGINCSACSKDILIKIFKCLLCQNTFLCSECYLKWQHKSHDKFIGKQSKDSPWIVTERSQFNIKKLNANLEYFKKFDTSNSQFIQLMGPKYEKFLSSYIQKPTLKQHIINSLLDVEKQVHKTYKKLDFTEKDIGCCVCKKKKIVGMRRMSCKHFIDEKCLKFLLQNQMRQCPVDKYFILPGLKDVCLQIQ